MHSDRVHHGRRILYLALCLGYLPFSLTANQWVVQCPLECVLHLIIGRYNWIIIQSIQSELNSLLATIIIITIKRRSSQQIKRYNGTWRFTLFDWCSLFATSATFSWMVCQTTTSTGHGPTVPTTVALLRSLASWLYSPKVYGWRFNYR